ncbi:MAG: crossover junction endodeoxyribonuclease RuvC, partial [Paludibacteraceae bacterium]|nr:crossover junction endodeoxyribonuclease RuvC [Paludibacteraceae bacterium]
MLPTSAYFFDKTSSALAGLICSVVKALTATVVASSLDPFFGKNVQSMLKLGRAQGVAIAVAVNKGLNVHEYSPLKIKMAITGNGASSKEQVAGMLARFLHINEDRMNVKLDATDALAAAYCHYLQLRVPVSSSPHYKSWKEFTTKNSGRVL